MTAHREKVWTEHGYAALGVMRSFSIVRNDSLMLMHQVVEVNGKFTRQNVVGVNVAQDFS